MVGAGESSACTTTDTNASFTTPSTAKRTIPEIWDQKLAETLSKYVIFSN